TPQAPPVPGEDDPDAPGDDETPPPAPVADDDDDDEPEGRAAPPSRLVTRGMKLSPAQRAALWGQFDAEAEAQEPPYRRAAELLFDRERLDVRREFDSTAEGRATRAGPDDNLIEAILRTILAKYGEAGEYRTAWHA